MRPYLLLVVALVLSSLPLKLVGAEPSADELLQQATAASERGESGQAVKLLSAVVAKSPDSSLAYYLRGREQFRLGQIEAAAADFDKAVELSPASESRQWERGIAYYYDGQFKRGARQFEIYQTYHDQDVENSVWRYLCVARTAGVEKARENMLPIKDDPRVPMMKIYDLYGGKASPQDVLKTANEGNPSREALNTRLFYAHLYLGLWYEAAEQPAKAREHILEAEKHRIGHYMWDVAHVHADRLRKDEMEKSNDK